MTPVNRYLTTRVFPEPMARAVRVHNTEEVGALEHLLPDVIRQRPDAVRALDHITAPSTPDPEPGIETHRGERSRSLVRGESHTPNGPTKPHLIDRPGGDGAGIVGWRFPGSRQRRMRPITIASTYPPRLKPNSRITPSCSKPSRS